MSSEYREIREIFDGLILRPNAILADTDLAASKFDFSLVLYENLLRFDDLVENLTNSMEKLLNTETVTNIMANFYINILDRGYVSGSSASFNIKIDNFTSAISVLYDSLFKSKKSKQYCLALIIGDLVNVIGERNGISSSISSIDSIMQF